MCVPFRCVDGQIVIPLYGDRTQFTNPGHTFRWPRIVANDITDTDDCIYGRPGTGRPVLVVRHRCDRECYRNWVVTLRRIEEGSSTFDCFPLGECFPRVFSCHVLTGFDARDGIVIVSNCFLYSSSCMMASERASTISWSE